MIPFTLQHLIRCFEGAKINDYAYVGVVVDCLGHEEFIIIPNTNFDFKLEYYKNAYTDSLKLKTNEKIRIVAFTYGDSFREIEKSLIL